MLRKVSDEILEALEHADDMARRARETPDADAQQAYLLCEHSWRKLAQSLEFSERLSSFSREMERFESARGQPINQVQVYRPPCARCGAPTTFVASQPDAPKHDVRSFRCETCGQIENAGLQTG